MNKFMQLSNNCPICYEGLSADIPPFSCGHTMHMACVQQHFRPECPMCRAVLPITVFGISPSEEEYNTPTNIPLTDSMSWRESLREEDNYFTSGPFSQEEDTDYDSDDSIYEQQSRHKNKGFLHEEEDLENWDEENPRGDEVEYDD